MSQLEPTALDPRPRARAWRARWRFRRRRRSAGSAPPRSVDRGRRSSRHHRPPGRRARPRRSRAARRDRRRQPRHPQDRHAVRREPSDVVADGGGLRAGRYVLQGTLPSSPDTGTAWRLRGGSVDAGQVAALAAVARPVGRPADGRRQLGRPRRGGGPPGLRPARDPLLLRREPGRRQLPLDPDRRLRRAGQPRGLRDDRTRRRRPRRFPGRTRPPSATSAARSWRRSLPTAASRSGTACRTARCRSTRRSTACRPPASGPRCRSPWTASPRRAAG